MSDEGQLMLGRGSKAHGARLQYRRWLPGHEPKAVILLMHGYGEHLLRYRHVAQHLVDRGFAMFALDHWGHGRSDGEPGFVPAFSVFIDGIDALLVKVRECFPQVPLFLVGHSMGGLISASYLLVRQVEFAGAVLSGPGLQAADAPSPLMMLMAKLASRLAPRMAVIQLSAQEICRDPKVVAEYLADPLVYKGPIGARLGTELFNAIQNLQAQAAKITLPILILHGSKDSLAAPEGSQAFYEHITSADKKLIFYPALYHEVFNEPEKEAVLSEMSAWLNVHLPT